MWYPTATMAEGGTPEIMQKYGRTFKSGEVIFREGEEGSEMYIIQSGKVRIVKRSRDEEKTLGVLTDGDFFGEMAVIDKGPRSATAVADAECQIIVFNDKVFESQIQVNPTIAKKIMKRMSARLREANERIATLLLKDNTSRVAAALLSIVQRQGKQVESGKELPYAATMNQISEMVAVEPEKTSEVLQKLGKARVLRVEGDNIVVTSADDIQRFMNYLAMKERFEI